ncbi:hypothetical protein Tco_1345913 [Tanacetum coccineum]
MPSSRKTVDISFRLDFSQIEAVEIVPSWNSENHLTILRLEQRDFSQQQKMALTQGKDVWLFYYQLGTDVGVLFLRKEKLESSLVELGCWSAVSETVLKSVELGAEAKGSLVLELEDLTLETQDANSWFIRSEGTCHCFKRVKSP